MLQNVSDNSGHTTAIIIPIEEWNEIRCKYPGVDSLEGDIPQWQKDIFDKNQKKYRIIP